MTEQIVGLALVTLVIVGFLSGLTRWRFAHRSKAKPSDPRIFLESSGVTMKSSGVLRILPAESLSLKIGLSPELIETLSEIQVKTGDPLGEVLAKAIALYRMSVEAHKDGKRIGVFDRDFELEREVVGLEHQASS